MLHKTIFLIWFTVNLIFLINFHLAGGYLAIVNFAFMLAAIMLPQHTLYGDD
jgi:hypothetical protein